MKKIILFLHALISIQSIVASSIPIDAEIFGSKSSWGVDQQFMNLCYGRLQNDTLTIGNNRIERKFLWNKGNIITYSLKNKDNNLLWLNNSQTRTLESPQICLMPKTAQ